MTLSLFDHTQRVSVGTCFLALTGCLALASPRAMADGCDQVEFPVNGHVPVMAIVYDVAVADVNGDSKQDLLILSDSGLFVSLGNGLGGFGPVTEYDAGVGSQVIAVGDFNGDGQPDVATSDFANVAILLNNGQGVFSAPTFFTAGTQPEGLAVWDFNGDGNLDLAVANFGSGNVSILLGDGTGSFGAPLNSVTGSGPLGVVAGDFDGDGKLDLATADYASMDVRILTGDGQGHFIAGNSYPVGGNTGRVVTADFNGDGKLDLAVNVYNVTPNNRVAIFLGNGNGSFTPGASISAYDESDLVAADLNGDGNIDVAFTTYGAASVEVALGDGAGNFGLTHSTALHNGSLPIAIAAGDLDGQGNLDLVTGNFGYVSRDASLLFNVPAITLTAPERSASEDGTKGRFVVTREGCNTDQLTIHYNVSGTAQPGVDYGALSGRVTIPAGEDSASIAVVPIDDTLVEGKETVIVTLSSDPSYGFGKRHDATVAIEDND